MERESDGARNRCCAHGGRVAERAACVWVCNMERRNASCVVQMVTETWGSVREWRRNAVERTRKCDGISVAGGRRCAYGE